MIKINNGIACNPYLPGKTYIPDVEPHIFKGRIYIYGSHDVFGGSNYCQGSYVGWSAPITDLSDWIYEGVILEKGQDPLDPDGTKSYYASDVAQGPDGRYYLYYSIEDSMVISVAVCDEPAGHFKFYGHVKDTSGHVLGSSVGDDYQFDPAVLVDDDNKIYLYSGQGMPVPIIGGRKVAGAMVCELAKDMITATTAQKPISSSTVNQFIDNPFFEASSVRKFGGKYYFIYSPLPNIHNLCYAISDFPDRDFKYQGVLVSNANIFQDSPENHEAQYYWGNNHGSILKIEDDFYIFYHRHTNRCSWNRHGCAEKLTLTDDGKFIQATMTSTGLQSEPFPARGEYSAYLACLLQSQVMPEFRPYQFLEFSEDDPYITQDDTAPIPFIANLRSGSKAGYRYFSFSGLERLLFVKVRGCGRGRILVTKEDGTVLTEIPVTALEAWTNFCGSIQVSAGTSEIHMEYVGEGALDLLSFSFSDS